MITIGFEFYIDVIKSAYGALRIDYFPDQGEKYFIYGYNNNETEWDFDKGELLFVTDKIKTINKIRRNFCVIESNEVFCRLCFKHKKIKQLENDANRYWVYNIWDGLPEEGLLTLQNHLLATVREFSWRHVKSITTKRKCIYYGFCNICMSEEEHESSDLINRFKQLIESSFHKIIAKMIMEKYDEKLLENYLARYLDLIEPDMELIKCQKQINKGIIDIFTKDKDGKHCIIELKTRDDDKKLVWQSAYYQSQFDDEVRVITIAPDYSEPVYNALKHVKNIEIKGYKLDIDNLLEVFDFKL